MRTRELRSKSSLACCHAENQYSHTANAAYTHTTVGVVAGQHTVGLRVAPRTQPSARTAGVPALLPHTSHDSVANERGQIPGVHVQRSRDAWERVQTCASDDERAAAGAVGETAQHRGGAEGEHPSDEGTGKGGAADRK